MSRRREFESGREVDLTKVTEDDEATAWLRGHLETHHGLAPSAFHPSVDIRAFHAHHHGADPEMQHRHDGDPLYG
ncbi:MAG TPA: hypothetical protein VFI41_04920 [Gemmatimonadales bacterium]|nr:hypothetical protein [Gemmatimonadales bacterium]